MKKFFAILLSLIMVTVVLGACTHNKVYGTVVVTPEKYKQISADKTMIEDSIKGLEKFNSENPESEQKVIKTLNTLIKKGQRHLNKQDRAEEKAEKALAMSIENQSSITDMKANTKWVWGVMIGVAGLAISGIALFL